MHTGIVRKCVPLCVAARQQTARTALPFGRGVSTLMRPRDVDPATEADASALLAEWSRRRDHIFEGTSDLLAKLQAQPRINISDCFANTDVSLDTVSAYGFDLDFTLVGYEPALQEMLYSAALRNLVDNRRYPTPLLQCKYDPSFPTRGLFFDTTTACLLKLDATQHIEVAFRGRIELKREEVARIYGPQAHVRYDALQNMRFLADIFCYSEICLLADVTDFLTRAQLSFDASHVFADVAASVGDVHRSRAMYNAVLAEPAKYIKTNPQLEPLLRRLRDANKMTFIISNSPYFYIDGVMTHMLGAHWRRYFDVVVAEAGKPSFYTSGRPFRRVFPETGRVDWQPVDRLLGGPSLYGGSQECPVFLGGSLQQFVKGTGCTEVLYCGDHIEADTRDARRYGWRTLMILHELRKDVLVNNSEEYRAHLAQLLEAKDFLSNVFSMRRDAHKYVKDVTREHLLQEMDDIRRRMRSLYFSPFGSVFSSADQSSLFGLRLFRWADVYTSHVTNLLRYDTDAYLSPHSTTKALPHDVRVVL